MSDEKQETIADIVAMLRTNARGERFDEFSFTSLADRIEAAAKRERDELVYAYDPTKAGRGRFPDGSAYALEAMREPLTGCHAIGNAAAVREALLFVKQYFDKIDPFNPNTYTFAQIEVDHIQDAISAALSRPARNCDRFADALDAQLAFLNEAWLISVDREEMLERDKYENWTDEMRKRYGRWLLASAEQKGEGDGVQGAS